MRLNIKSILSLITVPVVLGIPCVSPDGDRDLCINDDDSGAPIPIFESFEESSNDFSDFEFETPDVEIEKPVIEIETTEIEIETPDLEIETSKTPEIEVRTPEIEVRTPEIEESIIHNIIDISKFNTVKDYELAASEPDVEGVIMRVGGRGWGSGAIYDDTLFETHYKNFAATKKVKIGYYFYSQAINEEEAIEEAQYVLDNIKGKQCDFPIYWDTELADSENHEGRADLLSVSERMKVGLAFIKHIQSNGYRAGVYSNDSWYNNQLNFKQFVDAGASIWVARYVSDLSITPTQPSYDAWQYTSSGKVNGIQGNVDKSFVYTNLAGWESK